MQIKAVYLSEIIEKINYLLYSDCDINSVKYLIICYSDSYLDYISSSEMFTIEVSHYSLLAIVFKIVLKLKSLCVDFPNIFNLLQTH